MKEIVSFLADNWSYISTAFLVLIYIVLIFIKKRPLSLDEFQSILDDTYRNIPFFIQRAENTNLDGDVKKKAVLDFCVSHCVSRLGRSLTDKEENKVRTGCSYILEEVLMCPTKKGGFGRGEEKDSK